MPPRRIAEFGSIMEFLSELPRPVRGSRIVRPARLYDRSGYRYRDERFPYIIYYEVRDLPLDDRVDFDGWVNVYFIARVMPGD